jgi:putative ATP-binding cassette transporter
MPLFQLLRHHLSENRRGLVLLALLAGIANTLVLSTINAATEVVGDREGLLRFAILFGISILVFVAVQHRLMYLVSSNVERTIREYRTDLFETIRSVGLAQVESVSRAELFACISRELRIVGNSVPPLVIAMQAVALVCCCLIYMAWLSMTAFLLWISCTVVGMMIHFACAKAIQLQLAEAYVKENELVTYVNDLIDGIKEVKMSQARGRELEQVFGSLAHSLSDHRVTTMMLYSKAFVLSQVTFFLLAGLMVFIVPILSPTFTKVVVMTTTSSLFLIGPVSSIISALPNFANANASAKSILTLKNRLRSLESERLVPSPAFPGFTKLRLDNLFYQHRHASGEGGFIVGPIDLTVERGQVVFITGGNGSGKTTLIRLLTGLYRPDRGTVRLDDTVIEVSNLLAYRDLFATVFADNHLFTELYGLGDIDREYADRLFDILEMGHKSQIKDRRFTNVNLSGGQRKRLALIAALLERKPICIFDEWAADQDPYFREKFYRVILPMLRNEGITVFAITHDDKYFDAADVHLHMEDGHVQVMKKVAMPVFEAAL